jgi:predicted transcriptional regulator
VARTTVRITEETREKLRDLARESNEPMQNVLTKAVDAYRRRVFLEKANVEFAQMREDPASWATELAERQTWDATLSDGLKEE